LLKVKIGGGGRRGEKRNRKRIG